MVLKKRRSDGGDGRERPEKKAKSSVGISPSILREEAPFPRGGGSVLTPLEHKQIKIQAKQDVLFEQSTGKKAPKDGFEDEEAEEPSGDEIQEKKSKSKSRKGKSDQKKSKDAAGLAPAKTVRIESLSYTVRRPSAIDFHS